MQPDLPAGIWRHYKGHLYLVLGYAGDSTNNAVAGRVVVVYAGLELTGTPKPGPRMHVRDADEFLGLVEVDGQMVRRFAYAGTEWPVD